MAEKMDSHLRAREVVRAAENAEAALRHYAEVAKGTGGSFGGRHSRLVRAATVLGKRGRDGAKWSDYQRLGAAVESYCVEDARDFRDLLTGLVWIAERNGLGNDPYVIRAKEALSDA